MPGNLPRFKSQRIRNRARRRSIAAGGILVIALVLIGYGYSVGWDQFVHYRRMPFQGRNVERRLLQSLSARDGSASAHAPQTLNGVDLAALPDGRVLSATIDSPTLGHSLAYRIYLPPGYDDPRFSGMRYPVMYLLHGAPGGDGDWVDGANANQIADALIKTGTIPPMILVMPDGSLGNPHHDTQWGNSPVTGERVEDALVQDLIPVIDHTYRTLATALDRAIGGNSSGGYGAVNVALHHPDRFSVVAALSGYFRAERTNDGQDIWGNTAARRKNSPIELLDHQPLHIDIIAGRDDARYEHDSLAFARALTAHGIDHQMKLFPGGHSWGFWRDHLPGALRYVSRHLLAAATPERSRFAAPVAHFR
jgi:enterochelin esterase-like enzyme